MSDQVILEYTLFNDDGEPEMEQVWEFEESIGALDTAHEYVRMSKWINVTVVSAGQIIFDWKFYNQPEWARHVLARLEGK